MHPTKALLGGSGPPLGKHNKFLGHWGALGSQTQKGILTYAMTPNKQNPFAGAFHDAIFNSWRRASKQALYVVPPMVFFYYAMSWAIDRNHYLNSKQGRAEFGDEE
ncbi:UcrQ family protein [Xylariomycetidae sp. FL0641]|nr:UcrQ family protein [Xylariomycetidae sp. FL0641]